VTRFRRKEIERELRKSLDFQLYMLTAAHHDRERMERLLEASRFQDVAPTVTAYRWAYATRTGSVSRSRVKSLLPTVARIPTKPFIVSSSGAWCPQSSGHLRVELHRTRTPVPPRCGYESSSRKRANREMARRTKHCAGYGHSARCSTNNYRRNPILLRAESKAQTA
jgi:hypothetical protein